MTLLDDTRTTTHEAPQDETSEPAITPFTIAVPQADLDDLHERLARTRFTSELPESAGDMGVRVEPIRALVERWKNDDWRATEARLNELPQFLTTIDGQTIHFVHVRSTRADATPLVLLHGWPGSFVEFLDVIAPLTDPPEGEPAFHLVVPSLPGFAFSSPAREGGWTRTRMARAIATLMERLGYERYAVHGNDAGATVAPDVGRADPGRVVGVHVNQVYSFPSGDPDEFARMTDEERENLEFLQSFMADKMGYNELQGTQPQNLAHALADSPAGQLAWSYQLFGESVTPEFVLTNVALYWFTGTAASSMRLYWEDRHAGDAPSEPTTVPLHVSDFAHDFSGIRTIAERDHANIVSWVRHDSGGHYPAHEVPDLLVDDLRRAFGGA